MKIGDIETFEYLISQGADVNAQVVSTMDYALNWCDDERIEFAKILLKNGANPNLLTISGYHSLIVAMSSEDFNLAKLLIKNEADLNIVDDDRDSFINYLIRYDNYDLRSFIPLVDARIDTLTEENKRKYKGWKFATILL
jgi:ankyrin repeat protein